MAKKKANKGGAKKASESALPPERKEAAAFIASLDQALEDGSYAGVRHLGAHPPEGLTDEERAEVAARVERVQLDPAQLAVGGFAVLCVFVAAALTLVTG